MPRICPCNAGVIGKIPADKSVSRAGPLSGVRSMVMERGRRSRARKLISSVCEKEIFRQACLLCTSTVDDD